MPGDKIIRTGEIADEMYFLQKGSVQIIATDNKTPIAVLKEGSFFGEIGLVEESRRRTVTVLSLAVCVVQVLKKEDFDDLSERFPNEYSYFKNVAK